MLYILFFEKFWNGGCLKIKINLETIMDYLDFLSLFAVSVVFLLPYYWLVVLVLVQHKVISTAHGLILAAALTFQSVMTLGMIDRRSSQLIN